MQIMNIVLDILIFFIMLTSMSCILQDMLVNNFLNSSSLVKVEFLYHDMDIDLQLCKFSNDILKQLFSKSGLRNPLLHLSIIPAISPRLHTSTTGYKIFETNSSFHLK